MPYKFNEARRHRVPKAKYKVTNWPDYDAALVRRGSRFCCNVWTWAAGHLREGISFTSQAATSNSAAMNFAWALMSLPSMFRTCPFLIIAIAS